MQEKEKLSKAKKGRTILLFAISILCFGIVLYISLTRDHRKPGPPPRVYLPEKID